jgi:tetratricopeptide (TPR) repeat protein
MARVFLSYSRQDQSSAKAIASALERGDHYVWWDRHLEGGSRYASEIEGELKRADAVVVIWSHSSVQSPWVQDEAGEGRNSGRLVPVVIDDSQPPLGFRQFQAIDLTQWNGRSGAKILETVHRAIEARIAGQPDATDEAITSPRPRPSPGWLSRRAVLAALAALAMLIAGAVYWLSSSGGPGRPDLRVRLAAFTSLSADVPESVPHVLREEILAAFGTDALITATASDNGSSSDPAAYALRGSVRRVGDELRFTMHLTDEASGDTLWTQMLRRPASSADVAPRQVAVAVSQIVRCGLTGKAQHGGPLPDRTLSTFLSYCQEYMADSAGNVFNAARGLDIARRVVEESPDFSRGWSARAWSAARQSREPGADANALRSEARMAAERAIKLDPTNAQAFEVLAGLEARNSIERERLHIKSVSVRPGDCGCEWVNYGNFLGNVGRFEESANAYKRAHDMVPLSADVTASLAEALFDTGRAAEARVVVKDLLEVWPNDPVRELLVRSAFWTKDYDLALKTLADPRSQYSDEERAAYSAAVRAMQSGDTALKASAITLLRAIAARDVEDRRLLIVALAALGADREALAEANKLVGAAGSRDQYLLFEPPLDRIRRTPEFVALVQRIGLVRYWRQSKRAPDFCREPKAPALCRSLT